MMLTGPMLETDRLVLRLPRQEDWPAYLAYRTSARSTMHPGPDVQSIAWTHFAAFLGHWALRGFGRFAVVLKATGQAIGHAGPFQPAGHAEPELTWTLWSAEHEGKGFAGEAARATRDYAFSDLGWKTVVSVIDPANARSIALAERLGAIRDDSARRPDDWPEAVIYRHPGPEVGQ